MFELTPIGFVRSRHHTPAVTPIQARLEPTGSAVIETLPDYVAGLEGLDGFDFAWMLTLLHVGRDAPDQASTDPLRPVPFLASEPDQRVGVFATRYPVRPNPIGLSLIQVDRIDAGAIHFSGVDVVDGTPVIDLKPWVPRFDLPGRGSPESFLDVRVGWYTHSKLEQP